MRTPISLLFLSVSTVAFSQKQKKEDKLLLDNLQTHVQYLASDKLEGRRTGTAGEKLAADYISGQFQKNGLQPKGNDGWFQTFDINEGKQINPATHLLVNEQSLLLHKDFFPLAFSANASVESMPSITLRESGMPWFVDLKEILEQNSNNPHFDLPAAVKTKSEEVIKKGAIAVFLFNSSSVKDELAFTGKEKVEKIDVPVVYLTKEAMKNYFSDETASYDIKLKISIEPKIKQGKNVIGFVDNGAAQTIVLGAHYDHLGYGEDGNSMLRGGAPQIHNGADDNASGTAALIELSRLLKSTKAPTANYLFIAFSGEELGLFGSKYFVEHPTVDLAQVNYMINMDMVGRLNDSSKTLTVGGFGTSPLWGEAYSLKGKNALYNSGIQFRFDSSGTGPSDHTSFYRKDIPVLFYFTGLHTDYHKPTDDVEKINFSGQAHLVRHILSLLNYTNKQTSKLVFTKTREAQTTTSSRFTVSMGIMPDYTFTQAGVRVDGVSEGKAAQKAGIIAGDIITALGDNKVSSLEGYMQALGKFKKGDTTTVQVTRGNEQLAFAISF